MIVSWGLSIQKSPWQALDKCGTGFGLSLTVKHFPQGRGPLKSESTPPGPHENHCDCGNIYPCIDWVSIVALCCAHKRCNADIKSHVTKNDFGDPLKLIAVNSKNL